MGVVVASVPTVLRAPEFSTLRAFPLIETTRAGWFDSDDILLLVGLDDWDDQHWYSGAAHHSLGNGSEQRSFDSGHSVAADDNKVSLQVACELQDFPNRVTDHHVTNCRVEAQGAVHLLCIAKCTLNVVGEEAHRIDHAVVFGRSLAR
jgi:hypothetical protein